MILLFERRAEIAIRSVRGGERKKLDRAIQTLAATPPNELFRHPNIRKVLVGPDSTALYIYGGGMKLRIILAIEGEKCTVLDIADHDRLERLLLRGSQR